MYMLFLGVILGVGLTLAARNVVTTVQLRRTQREDAHEARIQAEVTRRYNEWADYNINIGKPVPAGPTFSSRRPSGPSTW